ncbi:Microcystin-dependent protein [Pseudomonas helmanticensis]|uniref:Microcystin-dependent protein n=1 Tax=Pseudomonas helmanticensis TaxID=1471381 RepID=A0ACD2U904_9PSED|nr:tail fiber protein [Pseudomonas helmanticensis]SMQ27788.1 Microcystin-dependent protein [Pseudomonas helmanticensis]
MDVYMGTVMTFAFNFAPSNWALCNGQIMSISQYNALFALLGTVYGGNGQQTFGLPNLQSRLPVCQGSGPGLTPRVMGEVSGAEQVTATLNNLPNHTHTLAGLTATTTVQLANPASNVVGTPTATNAYIGASGTGPGLANIYSDAQGASPVPLKGAATTISGTITPTGNGLPMPIMNPYLVLNFSIALNGIFPSRN